MGARWTAHADVPSFLADAEAHLLAREAENGLMLGLLAAAKDPPPFLARLVAAGETVACAYHSGLNLILSPGAGAAAADLVAAVHAARRAIPGVVGAPDDVAAVVAAIATPPVATTEQGLYTLTAVDWPPEAPGHMRVMGPDDCDLVTAWLLGFHADATPNEPYSEAQARAGAAARPAQGLTYLWEVDGTPVAMAALSRPTRTGITVNAVYVPPAHRRHGYATSLVAHLSAEGLRRGHAFCVLYTDLANPTSNAIYQRIGYRRMGSSRNVRFEPPTA